MSNELAQDGATIRHWSACPDCLSDLRDSEPQSGKCPFCGAPVELIWWQRYLFGTIAFALTIATPLLVGIRSVVWIGIVSLMVGYPVFAITFFVLLKVLPPKYEHRLDSLTLLPG